MNIEKLAEKYRKLIKERMAPHNITTAHDEKGHWYVKDGKKYGSVTKELQTLKDEGLMNWKMNRALEYIKDNWLEVRNTIEMPKLEAIIEQAKLAPQQEFEGAGDIGRQVHDWREKIFSMLMQGCDYNPAYISKDMDPAVISGCRGIEKFLQETGYIPVACELSLVDPEFELGGMLDDIGILPHPTKIKVQHATLGEGYKIKYKPKLCLIDLKTSNIGNKTSYFLQVALYAKMFIKLTGIRPQEYYILHVSKTDGSYKLIRINNITQLIKDATLLLKLNKSLRRIDEEKKKEPIVI